MFRQRRQPLHAAATVQARARLSTARQLNVDRRQIDVRREHWRVIRGATCKRGAFTQSARALVERGDRDPVTLAKAANRQPRGGKVVKNQVPADPQ